MEHLNSLDNVQYLPAEAAGAQVLRELRCAVAAVLSELPGAATAAGLARTLGLDRSLAWKIWRTAYGDDEFPSPKHVPGSAAFSQFIEAATLAGAAEDSATQARLAHRSFDSLVKTRAPDRASADILFGSLSNEGRSRLEAQLRLEHFRASSYFLGVRADTMYQINVIIPFHPVPDIAILRGHYGLMRMRPGAGCLLSRSVLVRESGPTSGYSRRALVGHSQSTQRFSPGSVGPSPVISELCSTPMPPVSRRWHPDGVVTDELMPGPIGAEAGGDVVIAELVTNLPTLPNATDTVTMQIRTPVEQAVFDVLIHRSLAKVGDPTMRAFTLVRGEVPFGHGDDRDELVIPERLEAIGTGEALPAPPGVSNHPRLTQILWASLAVNPAEYLLYRIRLRRPPTPMCLAVSYTLSPGSPRA